MSELLLDRNEDLGFEASERYFDALADTTGGSFVVGQTVEFGDKDNERQIPVTDLTPGEQQLNVHIRHQT